jgi:hypothetical protein
MYLITSVFIPEQPEVEDDDDDDDGDCGVTFDKNKPVAK